MKKSFLILLFSALLLTGCGKDPGGKGDNPGGDTPDPIPAGTYSKTIKLSGTEFSSFATGTNKQTDDQEFPGNKAQLLTYLQSKVDYPEMVSDIQTKKLNTAEWDTNVALCVGTGYYLNNKFNPGTLMWQSGIKIYNLQVKARAYTKNNSYQGVVQIDEAAKIKIDENESVALFNAGDETATIKTLNYEYPEGVDYFTISSFGARVVLEEVTITWKA